MGVIAETPSSVAFSIGPFEVVELENGEVEVERQGVVGFELLVQNEINAILRGGGDLGPVEKASGDHVEDLAGLRSQHPGKVQGLLAEQGGVGRVPVFGSVGVGYPAATGHIG